MKTAFASLNLAMVLVLGVATAAQAQVPSPAYSARIGWVSTERLFTESKLAKNADARIEEEFSKRQKAMQDQIAQFKAMSEKFDSDNPRLNEAERTRRTRELVDMEKDLQRKQREFREDLAQRKNEERANISQKAYQLIQQIAREENLDVVLQDSVWFNPRIDITDKILKQLDK
ncbi:OmpH family outer membrane protein [Pseudoduganella sp. GCM10020061]|jgi:outer membrane protein|uniref:OmpH family outer membrane protein n=1 Tax=Pseudoduganella sp. GCM10020061 TaxID=3317345 RepID=UPI003631A5C7